MGINAGEISDGTPVVLTERHWRRMWGHVDHQLAQTKRSFIRSGRRDISGNSATVMTVLGAINHGHRARARSA